ncbi:MAG: hypothetical protein J2P46_02890 [Zavarzinella sp.]|nr:hypothetical protein [Zavarzinella sp.]
MTNESCSAAPVRDPFALGPTGGRALRLRWDLVAIARRVLAARDGRDPVVAATLLPAGVRPRPDALPVSDLTRAVVHFLKEDGDPGLTPG